MYGSILSARNLGIRAASVNRVRRPLFLVCDFSLHTKFLIYGGRGIAIMNQSATPNTDVARRVRTGRRNVRLDPVGSEFRHSCGNNVRTSRAASVNRTRRPLFLVCDFSLHTKFLIYGGRGIAIMNQSATPNTDVARRVRTGRRLLLDLHVYARFILHIH